MSTLTRKLNVIVDCTTVDCFETWLVGAMEKLTGFQQLILAIQHDPELVNQVIEFYSKIGIEKELREKGAKFIENKEYWRNAAEMNPYQDTLYEDLKRYLGSEHEVFICSNIDRYLKKRYPNNKSLGDLLNECLLFERRIINKLNEGLIPDTKQIEDIIMECGVKTQELKSELLSLEMFGASQCDQSTPGNLVAASKDICQKLVQAITIWKRVQQLQQYITEEPPPNLNPMQKEFEGFADLLLSLKRFLGYKPEVLEILSQLERMMTQLITHAFVFEAQPKQNLKMGSRKQTKEFELKIRFLIGKTLLGDKAQPNVVLSFDCDHNFCTPDLDSKLRHKHGNISNSACPLVCAAGRMDWSCSADYSKLQVIGFTRCQGDKKSVWEQKYGLQATVVIPDDGFGHERQLQIRSLPIVVTTQTSQDWTAAAALFWDNAFADPERTSFQVPDHVPWSKVSRILSERFLKTVGRGLTMSHIACLESKMFGPSNSSREVSWSNFWKKNMDCLQFSFWKWFYAVHNLCVQHLKTAWALGLVEGFISKKETKKKLREPRLHSNNFILRFSDSKIEENESSTFGGSLVVAYNTVKDDGCTPTVSFLEPFPACSLSTMNLYCYLSSILESDGLVHGAGNKVPLDYVYPNRPFDEAFAPLKALMEKKTDTMEADEHDSYAYKILQLKLTVSNGSSHTPRANSCATSPAPSHYSYQDTDSVMSPPSVVHSEPVSPAAVSVYSPVSSSAALYGHAGADGIVYNSSPLMVDQMPTLNEMNAVENASGELLTGFEEYFRGDEEMPELDQILSHHPDLMQDTSVAMQ